MSATDQELVKSGGKIAPQFYNPTNDKNEHLTGYEGAAFYMLKGNMVIDAFNGNANVSKSYTEKVFGFGIINDGTADLTVSFNGLTILVKPGETFDERFKDGNTNLDVAATSTYRMVVRV